MSANTAHDVDMATQVHPVTAGTSTAPPAAVAAPITSPRKEPPPEKPSDSRRRSLVILSFWLIVLCLGLPIWWNTTTIPRASLPLDDMMDWAVGRVCHTPPFKLTLTFTLTSILSPWFPFPQDQKEHDADLYPSPRPAVQSFHSASPSRRASCKTRRPRTCCA